MRKSLILIAMIIGNLLTAAGEILWQGNQEINNWGGNTSLIFDEEHNADDFKSFQGITTHCDIYLKIEKSNDENNVLRISGQWGNSDKKWEENALKEGEYNLLYETDNIVKVSLSIDFVTKAFVKKGGIAFWGNGGFRITAIATTKDELMNIKLPDPDREGIDWNVADCMVESIIKAFAQDGNVNETQNSPAGGHDHDNATYLGVSRDVAAGNNNQPFYVVAKLKKPITVSDVELVWGNGYPLNYEVYALTADPGDEVANVAKALAEDKLLYSVTGNPVVSYEPYFNTVSELQGKGSQNGDTEYVVVKMWEPMGSTFGFKLDEIHVGAYDEEYNVVDHISVGNLTFNTEKSNARQLAPTARNSRNAILTGHTVTSVKYEVSNEQYVTIENTGGANKVWASFPGEYKLTVTGAVGNKATAKESTCYLTVNRDWMSETTNTKSIIQTLDDENFSATETEKDEYKVIKLKDGNEGTRWSSGSSAASATNQYITVKLSDTNEYKVRALEFLWERAYPLTYAVYGLNSKPSETPSGSYDEYKTANSSRLIYEATLPSGKEAKEVFPFHDFHQQGEAGFTGELNGTKYLVVAFREPVTQLNGDKYGVSIWELYAQVTDMTALNSTTKLEADNMVLYLKETNVDDFTVRATGGGNESVVVTGVEFAGAAGEGNALATAVTLNAETNRYEVKNNNVLVAEIWDAGNNTYKIKAGSDKSIAGKRYNITAEYVKGRSGDGNNNDKLTTTFTLDIIKKPMDLVSQDPRHLVFDDGYYVESRLEKYASPEVLTVDLTNVDFDTDYKNESLAAALITAPRFLNKDENKEYKLKDDETKTIGYAIGKNINAELQERKETILRADRKEMNPNAVYYVKQDAFESERNLKDESNRVHGENVALRYNIGNDGVWYIHELRVFDGYDYAPAAPTVTVNNIKAHYGIFYTNLPTNKKTTISMPFAVRLSGLSSKGIKFYKPASLDTEERTIALKEQNGANLEAAGTYIVESTDKRNWSETGGYAVALASYPYKSENVTDNVDVAMSGKAEGIEVSGSTGTAVLESSFVSNKLTNGDASNDYYLYSAASERFLPANDDWFNYQESPDHVSTESPFYGKDSRLQLLPFYAYLKIPKVNSIQASKGFVFILEDETTGINTPQSCVDSTPDTNAPMFDLTGRRVNENYRGIVIQNGKKYLRR